ncbi:MULTISPECIES: universal stress protein [unclassified Rhizobium]|uniref:universal stress protein n=1 Tax=unclassified Rhizobium TaxID=2613769 RepID=UPI0016002B6D|nr:MULTISPECIES: universal stress protein [unclassified Rhizobium]MBB1248424.1 universal stress protein [Rhizobium sp. G21]MCV3766642.1 universal stress protein [Rhizobium sp. TRM95796]
MFKKIIVPVDIGQLDKGEKILRKAMELVDDGGVILLLNVAEDIPGYMTIELPADFIEASIREAVDRLKALNDKTGATAQIHTRVGSPAREILAVAEEQAADLVIIASHRPDFSNYLLGSTADRVVRHAKCSVLVDR